MGLNFQKFNNILFLWLAALLSPTPFTGPPMPSAQLWTLSAEARISIVKMTNSETNALEKIVRTKNPSAFSLRTSFLFLPKKIPGVKGQEVAYLFQSRFHKYQSET